MTNPWRRWRRLPPVERRLLLRSFVLLWGLRLILWTLPFSTWRRLLRDLWSEPAAGEAAPQAGPATAEQVARAVRRAGRAVPGSSCLVQAVAAKMLLRRHGREGTLHIGVAKDGGGRVEAHAWVEQGGRVLVGALPDLASYTRLPPPGARER